MIRIRWALYKSQFIDNNYQELVIEFWPVEPTKDAVKRLLPWASDGEIHALFNHAGIGPDGSETYFLQKEIKKGIA